VTGSDLKKRIERIMQNDARATLNAWRKILVVSAAVIAIVGPMALGALNAPPLRAQSLTVDSSVPAFSSVSVKANASGDLDGSIMHIDARLAPVYALVLARSDGTLGPHIRPSACAGPDTPRLPGPLDPTRPPPVRCGEVGSRPGGTVVCRWVTMEEFAWGALSLILDRKVVDRTGLTGNMT
jgi:hypothetical protein